MITVRLSPTPEFVYTRESSKLYCKVYCIYSCTDKCRRLHTLQYHALNSTIQCCVQCSMVGRGTMGATGEHSIGVPRCNRQGVARVDSSPQNVMISLLEGLKQPFYSKLPTNCISSTKGYMIFFHEHGPTGPSWS